VEKKIENRRVPARVIKQSFNLEFQERLVEYNLIVFAVIGHNGKFNW